MQSNIITESTSGPRPNEYQITCKSGRKRMKARALTLSLQKYGVRVPGEGWRRIINPAPTDVTAHIAKLTSNLDKNHEPKKLMRMICLVDNGLDVGYKSAVYKIALYCLAAFEHDARPWWYAHAETVDFWDDRKHRRFRAMMCALGFEAAYNFRRGDRPTPEELYLGRLLAADLGLAALAAYADIFGGRRAERVESEILYSNAVRDAVIVA